MADTKDPDEAMDAMDTVATAVDTADMDSMQTPPPTEGEAPAEQGLNLSDIRACVTIIDIVTKRGAFEGAELADVGSVRNRLDNFLKAAAEAQAPAEGEAETETTTA
jgi:hypothetical protein